MAFRTPGVKRDRSVAAAAGCLAANDQADHPKREQRCVGRFGNGSGGLGQGGTGAKRKDQGCGCRKNTDHANG